MRKMKKIGAIAALALSGLFAPASASAAGADIQLTVPFEIKGIPASITEVDIVCEVIFSKTSGVSSTGGNGLFAGTLYPHSVQIPGIVFRRTIKVDPKTGNAIDKSPLIFSVSDAKDSNGNDIPAKYVERYACGFVDNGGFGDTSAWFYKLSVLKSSFTKFVAGVSGTF